MEKSCIELSNVVSVDPGWNTGLAYWTGDIYPMTSIIEEPPRRKKLKLEPPRFYYMFSKFEAYMKAKNPDEMLIEGVEMWMGSTVSMAAAARGNLFSLAYLVGGYMAICYRLKIKVRLVYARGKKAKGNQPAKETWKGQLNAGAIDKRIYRLNKTKYPEHIREAVGIGFHCMGIL